MRVALAALADYAIVGADGKLTIHGIFNRFTAPSLPGVLPMLFVPLGLNIEAGDRGRDFRLTVRIKAPSELIIEKEDTLTVASDMDPRTPAYGVLPFFGVPFKETGLHQVTLLIDNNEEQVLPLLVVSDAQT